MRLIRDIRVIELAMGDGIKRVYDSELQARQRLRRK
jgi:N-acetylneuraminate synthase